MGKQFSFFFGEAKSVMHDNLKSRVMVASGGLSFKATRKEFSFVSLLCDRNSIGAQWGCTTPILPVLAVMSGLIGFIGR